MYRFVSILCMGLGTQDLAGRLLHDNQVAQFKWQRSPQNNVTRHVTRRKK